MKKRWAQKRQGTRPSGNTVDFIRNNTRCHKLSLCFRYRTRRLGKPHAMSMRRAAIPSFVLRSPSFTRRERFTPARACSTRTQTREMGRLVRFSAAVSSPLRGFFSAAASGQPRVHTPESRGPCTSWGPGDRQAARCRQSSCRAACPPTSDSKIPPAWSWPARARPACHRASSSGPCRGPLVVATSFGR